MKLKKLMALALAGVMAVSMLAGCNGNTKDPIDPEVPETVANDISNGVAGNIEDLPEYVTFAGNAKLSSALDYVGEFVGVKDVADSYINKVRVEEFGGRYNQAGTLQGRLEEAVGADEDITIANIGSVETLFAAEAEDDYSIEPATTVRLYAISGVIEANALNTLVAEAIEDDVTEYNYSLNKTIAGKPWNPDLMDGGIYNHSYTVSVSTSSKTVGESVVTLVAVQVVRTSAHQ